MPAKNSTLLLAKNSPPVPGAQRPRTRLLLNKLETQKIPSLISIFNVEHFRINTCYTGNVTAGDWTVCTDENGSAPAAGEKPAPEGEKPAPEGEKAVPPEENEADLAEVSDFLVKNNSLRVNSVKSYVYKTRKEFDLLYFPKTMTKEEKKLMFKLFRFIFGDTSGMIEQSMVNKLITPFDKVPCNQGSQSKLWTLFKKCIEYRIHGSEENGLTHEITSIKQVLPEENMEVRGKQYLRAQLLRMLHILDEKWRTCVVFSGAGGELQLSEYHTAILELIRKTVTGLMRKDMPGTQEQLDENYKSLIKDIVELKPIPGNNREIYTQMITVVQGIFNRMKAIDKDVNATGNLHKKILDLLDKMKGNGGNGEKRAELLAKLKEIYDGVEATEQQHKKMLDLLETFTPAASMTGGGRSPPSSSAEADADAEAEEKAEEAERVLASATEHSKKVAKDTLEEIYDILGGKDLESSVEHAVQRKGFSLSSTMSVLRELENSKNKSFLRCVETLLEIREAQMNAYEPPPDLSPAKRYSYILSKYPSLKEYLPKDILRRGSLADLGKKLRRIYPYTDSLIEDIKVLRKEPDPCSLFYKALLVMAPPRARKICKKLCEKVPRCKEIVEEVLLSCQVEAKGLLFKEVSLPKGFWAMADDLRKIPVPSLPVTIHEEAPKDLQKVLGEHPFLLIGTGTLLTGIKDMEIDVSDEIEEIRKGEISLGAVMFLYLYIMCDSHIDV